MAVAAQLLPRPEGDHLRGTALIIASGARPRGQPSQRM